ncbi:hypothetical protein [Listeria innocua]|uniref:hypothetical protein n=1 Tax=Listeria innocua TaxID=1642 RepID=UPI00086BF5A2|nr:hypothetical protein [Listeria innocua]OEO36219.1 hypothetical protein AJU45_11455 [Listeria monocytogenes]MBC1439668.1 hypothetical protein [Listeria innocua]MBF2442299.1 hypothetical protein [Listeria innocua]MBF2659969.1 hypothetical protein [Listeria innocua]MDG0896747.1 hypothetical protein [Listeria innocua]
MDYIILKNSADKKMILDDIFFEISRRKSGIEKALKNFSQLEGYIVEGKAICFRKDLDEFELSQLKIPLDNEHVLVDFEADYSSIDKNSQAYFTFNEFYEYVEKNVENYVTVDNKINMLLLEVKARFGL